AVGEERLRLAHLRRAHADRSRLELQLRDRRAFVRLGVRPRGDARRRELRLHRREVLLEFVEIDAERRRVRFPLSDADARPPAAASAPSAAIARISAPVYPAVCFGTHIVIAPAAPAVWRKPRREMLLVMGTLSARPPEMSTAARVWQVGRVWRVGQVGQVWQV